MSAVPSRETLLAAIESAKAIVAARNYGKQVIEEKRRPTAIVLNEKQQLAVDMALGGKSFCLTGSAGSGKTTTTKNIINALMQSNRLPPLEAGTKFLAKGAPGVALIAYTRRAVRNIAKQMSEDFKQHCITYHKLVEYEPEFVTTILPNGEEKTSKPFLPQRRQGNTLPANLRTIFIDEASMLSIDFWNILKAALPNWRNVQLIFIGDINQLPPIYGDGVLGLQINTVPVVNLTEVYRQALESPIIELALQIKDNNLPKELACLTKDWVKDTPAGKVTLVPWKMKLDMDQATSAINKKLTAWVNEGYLDFETDVILCPWGKKFGTIEMNKAIGTALARKENREVYEVIAGFNKLYFSIGDKVLVDKEDAVIIKIERNYGYYGKHPQPASKTMDYWGWGGTGSDISEMSSEDIDDFLDKVGTMDDVTNRVAQASHVITVQFAPVLEGETGLERKLTTASELNFTDLAYAMSVHKSQGSEWKRVFVITHEVHSKMLLRELVYTAFTRASRELFVIMSPTMLAKAARNSKIKGDTLEDKMKWFAARLAEKGRSIDSDPEEE